MIFFKLAFLNMFVLRDTFCNKRFIFTGRISIECSRRPRYVHHNRRHVIRQTPYSVAKTSLQIRILLSTYCDTDCRQRSSICVQVRSFNFFILFILFNIYNQKYSICNILEADSQNLRICYTAC